MDLSLIDINDLKNEIFSRCDEGCLIVMNRTVDNKDPLITVASKNGNVNGLGLAKTAEAFFVESLLATKE